MYTFLDMFLMYPLVKDFEKIIDRHKYLVFGVNLASFIFYFNFTLLTILPIYLFSLFLLARIK
jgi:hypothetical protein